MNITPKEKTPKLLDLSQACDNGACNSYALIVALGEAVKELQTFEVKQHPAIKVILGQISYLCGESCGPTTEALTEFYKWVGKE